MFCNIKVIALSVLCTRLSSSLLSLENSLFIAHASDHWCDAIRTTKITSIPVILFFLVCSSTYSLLLICSKYLLNIISLGHLISLQFIYIFSVVTKKSDNFSDSKLISFPQLPINFITEIKPSSHIKREK